MEDLASNIDILSPNFLPNTSISESEHGHVSIWTAIQKPGDLLVIPAYWWHQTYAFEPSLAIASQRGGKERDCARVLKHIIDTSQQTRNDYPAFVYEEYIQKHSMKNIVGKLFGYISNN
jgi:ribosomal protein L16 Arg81 hydroxylase